MDTLHAMRTYTYLLFIYIHLFVHRRRKRILCPASWCILLQAYVYIIILRALRVYIGIYTHIYGYVYILINIKVRGMEIFYFFDTLFPPMGAHYAGALTCLLFIYARRNAKILHVHISCSSRRTVNLRSEDCLHHYPACRRLQLLLF